jgi:hypothetical protein
MTKGDRWKVRQGWRSLGWAIQPSSGEPDTGEPDARKRARPVREGAVGFPSPEGAGRLPHNSSLESRALFYSVIACDYSLYGDLTAGIEKSSRPARGPNETRNRIARSRRALTRLWKSFFTKLFHKRVNGRATFFRSWRAVLVTTKPPKWTSPGFDDDCHAPRLASLRGL